MSFTEFRPDRFDVAAPYHAVEMDNNEEATLYALHRFLRTKVDLNEVYVDTEDSIQDVIALMCLLLNDLTPYKIFQSGDLFVGLFMDHDFFKGAPYIPLEKIYNTKKEDPQLHKILKYLVKELSFYVGFFDSYYDEIGMECYKENVMMEMDEISTIAEDDSTEDYDVQGMKDDLEYFDNVIVPYIEEIRRWRQKLTDKYVLSVAQTRPQWKEFIEDAVAFLNNPIHACTFDIDDEEDAARGGSLIRFCWDYESGYDKYVHSHIDNDVNNMGIAEPWFTVNILQQFKQSDAEDQSQRFQSLIDLFTKSYPALIY